ncbi:type II toxin-antitoxin system CcdA family antitoxin [Paucibacter soli]|uniref:type II toxin-antitoxin system CcdA family antitoxin n=1 Tax=Paucibacter soli TaxID=3133433 RepID=UPI0040351BCF
MSAADVERMRWLIQNREALDSSNAYVEQHGLPLAEVAKAAELKFPADAFGKPKRW